MEGEGSEKRCYKWESLDTASRDEKHDICTLPDITKSFRCKWMYYCRVFNDIIE